MKRVLVTGGVGFVGSHLVRALACRGIEVCVLDAVDPRHQARTLPLTEQWTFDVHIGDVRDDKTVAQVVDGVDTVYHLASHVGVGYYLNDPVDVASVIYDGTRTVARACERQGVPLVFLSTSEVYGRNPELPWAENADLVVGDPSKPRWVYAVAKVLSEQVLFGMARRERLRFSTARLFNLYGPGQDASFFVTRTLWRLANGLPAILLDGGKQVRCFTYVEDAVDGLLRLTDTAAAEGQAFNIGSDTPIRVTDAVAILAGALGIAPDDVRHEHRRSADEYGSDYEEPATRIPDVSKARAVLGWSPSTTLAEGADAILAWVKSHGWWTQESLG